MISEINFVQRKQVTERANTSLEKTSLAAKGSKT